MALSDWLARQDAAIGLVATDIVQSTSLLFEARTIRYSEIVRCHRTRADELVAAAGGWTVDASGDSILAAFPSGALAFRVARDLFRDTGHPQLKIRVGVHCGPVRVEGHELVGRSVHFCARVMQRANEGAELWVSDAARQAIESDPSLSAEVTWMDTDDSTLKGIPELHRLWRAA